jgi:putative endonuclease
VLYPIELTAHWERKEQNHKEKRAWGKSFCEKNRKFHQICLLLGMDKTSWCLDPREMRDERQQTGEWSEALAERELRRNAGMRVLDRRWRHGHGEIDLIMRQGKVLVFVEVRVRTGEEDLLGAYRSIRRKKWRVLRSTAVAYLRQCPWNPEAVRFDVVGILRKSPRADPVITHWENVGVFGRNFRF